MTAEATLSDVLYSVDNLCHSIESLGKLDLTTLAGTVGKSEARAIIAEERLEDEQRKTAGTEAERVFFRKRMQLFENLIHVYHDAFVFYSTRGNWSVVLDPDQPTSVHAIPHGWEKAAEALEAGLRHSRSLGEHLKGSPEAIRNKLLADQPR